MSAELWYRNLFDTATVTAPTALAGYGADELKLRELSSTCRLPLGANPITIDLGTAMRVDGVAVLGTNHRPNLRLPSDLIVETSTSVFGPWTAASIGLPSDSGARDLPRHVIGRVRAAGGGIPINTRYVRVTPNWNVDAGVTYREMGRIFLARVLEIDKGPSAGWSFGVIDPGELDVSDGGQAYEDSRDRGRSLRITCANLSVNEAYGFASEAETAIDVPSIQDMLMAVGKTGELLAIHRAESPLWIRRTAIYGHLSSESLNLTHVAGDTYRWDATVIEEH